MNGPRLKPIPWPITIQPAKVVLRLIPTMRWSEQYRFAYIQNVKPNPETIRPMKIKYRKLAG